MRAIKLIQYPSGGLTLPPLAIALGFFDGVHIGHRALIKKMKKEAALRSLATAIFTFGSENESLKRGVTRLYSTAEKLDILASLGVDYLIVADFSAIAGAEPKKFVKEHLVGALNCRLAAVGYNFRFGRGAAADADTLSGLMTSLGREAIILPEERFEGAPLSTTEIRAALSRGDCRLAARMLGAPYYITAVVEHGRGIGKAFGFPTLNTKKQDGTPLPRGVYATVVEIGEERHIGVTNVGTCPTFGEREEHLETMLLDFDRKIYGERVRIHFIEWLRDEEIFPTPEALKAQIDRDAERATALTRDYI